MTALTDCESREVIASSSAQLDASARIRYLPPPMSTRTANALWGKTQYRLAKCPQDRLAAFRLVYRRYVDIGLIEPNADLLRVTPFHLRPTTTVFIGCSAGKVFGTVTLVADGQRGLPLEPVFKHEIQKRRAAGLSMGEVSCLAISPCNSKSQFRRRFLQLNRVMAQFARHHGIDALVIAINPRHVRYYHQLMGFEQFGGIVRFPSVRNHPAAACLMQFKAVDANPPPAYDAIFNKQISTSEFRRYPMTPEERESLALIAAASGGDSTPLAVA